MVELPLIGAGHPGTPKGGVPPDWLAWCGVLIPHQRRGTDGGGSRNAVHHRTGRVDLKLSRQAAVGVPQL